MNKFIGLKKKHLILMLCIGLICTFVLSGCIFDDEDEARDVQYGNSASTSASTSVNNGGSSATTGNFEGVIRNPRQKIKGNSQDTVTILVYMNGSDLESDDGEATTDIQEMIAAGGSDKVNILIQTMGTKSWKKTLGIASDRSQIYCLNKDGFKLVKDDLGQLDCTVESTLKDFIVWGVINYPADRYVLQFWNHGGGPVYGFGYDQFAGEYDALTIDEMKSALSGAGVYFDFIGMDCCIMSSLEVCCALYDFCDYTILCEDFESGLGWSYTEWLSELYNNTSITIPDLGKTIVDSMVDANKRENESAILSVIDEGVMKVLYSSWVNFAYANEDALLNTNYSQKTTRTNGGRIHPALISRGFFSGWMNDDSEDNVTLSDYYITDIMAVAQNVDSDESRALSTALAKAIVYMQATDDAAYMTGISVTLPYGDSDFYSELKNVFANSGFDSEYINWLGKFVDASGTESFYDYDEWDDDWSGWDDYDDDYDWYGDDWSLFDFIFDGEWDDDDWSDDDWYGWDDYGWSDWDYDDSWNEWYDDNYYDYDYDDYGDDYYYDYYYEYYY